MDSKMVINNKTQIVLSPKNYKISMMRCFFCHATQPMLLFYIYCKSNNESKDNMKFLKRVIKHDINGCTISKCIVEGR